MDITPILKRELMVATRKRRQLWVGRVSAVGMLVLLGLGVFGARYYWNDGKVPLHVMIASVAYEMFVWAIMVHFGLIFASFASRAALAIADEKDRRTLDFLLASCLNNGEIVLGKLVACGCFLLADFAVGLPVMLICHSVGGIDLGLILLAYAGLSTTAFFSIALALWVSSRSQSTRLAVSASVLWWTAWLIGPTFASLGFPGLGLRLPRPLLSVNAWLLNSSPIGVFLKIAGGVRPSSGLTEVVAWMSGLQVVGGAILITWAIATLRSSYLVNTNGDTQSLIARVTRVPWRWRPKPPVGDDPILWREMNLARGALLTKLFGYCVFVGIYGAVGYATYFFARPAFVEVWKHGYSSGITSADRPEWNLAIRFFFSSSGAGDPADFARTELNLYLRNLTPWLLFVLALVVAGMANEAIMSERARETWFSLIATPLTAREILRGKMLAAVWRVRLPLATLLVLWAIGLLAGAIHPVGFVLSVLVVAATMWLMLAFALCIAIGAPDMAATTGPTLGLMLLLTGSSALPFLLPSRISSVLFGVGSPPFVAVLSLFSYRDWRNAWHFRAFPFLQWIQLNTGEGLLAVSATCVIGVILPATAGFYFWRYAVNHFDRRIGRPQKFPGVTHELSALSSPVAAARVELARP